MPTGTPNDTNMDEATFIHLYIVSNLIPLHVVRES